MTIRNHRQTGSSSWRRVSRRAVGAGAAVAVLASAGVATAAPRPAAAAAANHNQAHAAASKARPDSTINVRPGSVTAGARVRITGDAPRKARTGSWITLQSFAFNSKTTVNGVPAVKTQVLANGTYSVSAATRGSLKTDRYAIAGSFKGQPLSQVAWLSVRAR